VCERERDRQKDTETSTAAEIETATATETETEREKEKDKDTERPIEGVCERMSVFERDGRRERQRVCVSAMEAHMTGTATVIVNLMRNTALSVDASYKTLSRCSIPHTPHTTVF